MALRDVPMCGGCLQKMRQIDRLKAEVKRQQARIRSLEEKLNAVPRTINEAPFGASTPSSRIPIKPGAAEDKRQRKGGARPGHPGHGRKVTDSPDLSEQAPVPQVCPHCHGPTEVDFVHSRTVTDIIPQRTVHRRIDVQHGHCLQCGQKVEAPVSGVLPRRKYGNRLLATVACQHHLAGRTQGDVCREAGIGLGAFNHAMHDLARWLQPCLKALTDEFLQDCVRFADETTWREDGVNCYVWLLSTLSVCIYLVGRTRAAVVPLAVFTDVLAQGLRAAGVLVVDRYSAYARLPLALQYCYAHLKRDVETLAAEFPDQAEVQRFCTELGRLLARAMKLRGRRISDRRYYQVAAALRARIIRACDQPANHPGVQAMQDIFRRNPHRLYHWADDRRVPAENNYSERSLRPLVISRKLSFGTQSPRGSRTRETLMSVLHSLRKRGHDPVAKLTEALDARARDPDVDVVALLFPPRPPPPPLRQPAPPPARQTPPEQSAA